MLDICERKRGARKNDQQSVSLILTWVCFFQLLYLVLFSVGVILILFSILFSQISKWYFCIMLTSALFSLLCHRGLWGLLFHAYFKCLCSGDAHIFISFISLVAHGCTYILWVFSTRNGAANVLQFSSLLILFQKGITNLVSHNMNPIVYIFLFSYKSNWQSNLPKNFSKQKI